jgi:methionyl-tRNA formyltransferase
MENKDNKLKIVFFGTSSFATPPLEALIKSGMAPFMVVTSPDKPAGRGKNIISSPVKALLGHSVSKWTPSLLQPEKLDADFISKISDLKPDLGIVAAYGKIIPKELIDIFKHGILNIHPSLLPKYRGPSPIQTTILNGDKITGVTIILIDEKMDHGSILAQQSESSEPTYIELHEKLANLGAELLIKTIPNWVLGYIDQSPQNDSEATFTKLIKKLDGKIDWSEPANNVERKIRAYNPWPGTYTTIDNKILKIIKAEIIDNNKNTAPGNFFKENEFPAIACKEKALKLLRVQLEGKKEMGGDEFLRGQRSLIIGSR